MIHQKLRNAKGKVTVEWEIEDWAWLCDLLARILKEPGSDDYAQEDTQHILDLLEAAEVAIFNS